MEHNQMTDKNGKKKMGGRHGNDAVSNSFEGGI